MAERLLIGAPEGMHIPEVEVVPNKTRVVDTGSPVYMYPLVLEVPNQHIDVPILPILRANAAGHYIHVWRDIPTGMERSPLTAIATIVAKREKTQGNRDQVSFVYAGDNPLARTFDVRATIHANDAMVTLTHSSEGTLRLVNAARGSDLPAKTGLSRMQQALEFVTQGEFAIANEYGTEPHAMEERNRLNAEAHKHFGIVPTSGMMRMHILDPLRIDAELRQRNRPAIKI